MGLAIVHKKPLTALGKFAGMKIHPLRAKQAVTETLF